MTDFRQVWRLHAYSGGTVRDSHPVFYSLAALSPHPQALKRNIYFVDSIHDCSVDVNRKGWKIFGGMPILKEYSDTPPYRINKGLYFV